eukprot:TRINITY_DN10047_c0_g1_i1.p1 TRINITY_DN10047_c0_g1~~TRINITY_DN10047_c0_g1_i1.p1  ORF type:complete len:348 (+),score=42.24 TRINITY_DN10047_c0_g1_i1:106-1149(+)
MSWSERQMDAAPSPRGNSKPEYPNKASRDVTLTVFMEGTSNPMEEIGTQIALFSRLCTAKPLPEELPPGTAAGGRCPGHYKVSFAGCGVTHGFRGVVFATGLREQCAVVRTHVEAFLKHGFTVTLNFVGLSRGGIGGLYLVQELRDFHKDSVLLNLLLFDPVPGNFVWISRFFDIASQSNTNQAMDVSFAENLGRVVVLYPHEPLPAIAVHAPLLARFPKGCDLEEDVILGCHQGALFLRARADTCLAFARIRDFLLSCGTMLDRAMVSRIADLDVSDTRLVEMLDRELRIDAPTYRCAHAAVQSCIVRHSTGQFLNKSHEALVKRLCGRVSVHKSKPQYMLDIMVE